MKAAALEDNEWIQDAIATIISLAHDQGFVAADDLTRHMRPPADTHWPGAAFRAAMNAGHITSVGRRPSTNPSRKGARIDVWRAVKENK